MWITSNLPKSYPHTIPHRPNIGTMVYGRVIHSLHSPYYYYYFIYLNKSVIRRERVPLN